MVLCCVAMVFMLLRFLDICRLDTAETGLVHPKVFKALKLFSTQNKLKRKALGIIAQFLSSQEIESLRKEFAALDKDGNGKITCKELVQSMKTLGLNPSNSDVSQLIAEIDSDGDGLMDYQEFLAASMEKKHYMRDDLLYRAFQSMDIDRTGSLTRDNIRTLLSGDDSAVVDDIISTVDTDASGAIDFEEFKQMMEWRWKLK